MTADLLVYCLSIAIVAFVYSNLLTDPEKLLCDLYLWLEKRLPWYLFNPIIGCEICVAGQITLWHYLIKNWNNYNPEIHILSISLSILITSIIKELHAWLKRKALN